MSAKQLKFDENARKALLEGVSILAKAVKATGANVKSGGYVSVPSPKTPTAAKGAGVADVKIEALQIDT